MEVPKTSTTLRFALLLTAAGGFLDAYTYISRGGVFANAQTGNVILMAIDLSERHFHAARAHLWPILAFIVGVAFAHLLKGELAHSVFDHPIRIAMVAQIVVLVAVAFVPANVPNALVTVPIAFVAAMQFGLFRTIGSLSYIAVATTGNLMRFTESAYAGFIEKVPRIAPAHPRVRRHRQQLRRWGRRRSVRHSLLRRIRRLDPRRPPVRSPRAVLHRRQAAPPPVSG